MEMKVSMCKCVWEEREREKDGEMGTMHNQTYVDVMTEVRGFLEKMLPFFA